MKNLKSQRQTRARSVRAKISGAPRLSVFRSNKYIYAQIIDDKLSKTLISASDVKIKGKGSRVENAKSTGTSLAKAALAKKITKVVFDRGSYKYHGRVKVLAEEARIGGLKF